MRCCARKSVRPSRRTLAYTVPARSGGNWRGKKSRLHVAKPKAGAPAGSTRRDPGGGATRKDDVQRKRHYLSAGSGHPPVSRGATKIAMAHGLYLSGNMGNLYIKHRTPSLKPVQPSFRSAFQKNS